MVSGSSWEGSHSDFYLECGDSEEGQHGKLHVIEPEEVLVPGPGFNLTVLSVVRGEREVRTPVDMILVNLTTFRRVSTFS